MAMLTISSNMGLSLPVAGPQGRAGPDWANDLIKAYLSIDSHDHSTGRGVKITPAGLNINSDLSISQRNLIDLRSSRFFSNTDAINGSSDLNCVYVKNGDLYFNNGSGTSIQLTSAGAINVSSLGAITGDYSSSSANLSYSDTTKVFSFTQSSGITAKLACADVSIYEAVSSGNAVTFKVPTGLASSYSITLGSALPSATRLVRISSAGVWTYGTADTDMLTDNAITDPKIRQSSGLSILGRASNTTGNIADITASSDGYVLRRSGTTLGFGQVVTAGIADAAITQVKKAVRSTGASVSAGGLAISSSSSGSYTTTSTSYADVTGLTVTITTLGNPVMLMLLPTTSVGAFYITNAGSSGPQPQGYIKWVRDSTDVAEESFWANTGTDAVSPGLPKFLDTPAAGTYVYKVQAKAGSGSSDSLALTNLKLYAWEL
ncbi:MAG: hypothetical protein E6R03_02325 [Hyphomicrobiaceae bacterium]|nr:MAG: hypothetical protein E6R03_02325 [Hyphomicrobiaceae bacterium]